MIGNIPHLYFGVMKKKAYCAQNPPIFQLNWLIKYKEENNPAVNVFAYSINRFEVEQLIKNVPCFDKSVFLFVK